MVELVALVVADATRRLWKRATPGRMLAVLLWLTYGAAVPQGLIWAEQVLPEEVNLGLPFAGVLVATGTAVRHYRHRHHHHAEANVNSQVSHGVS